MILALVNTDIIWESSNENLLNCDRIISELIHNVNHTVDIVIFPEFFTTGFSMNPKIAQNMSGDVLNWMKRKSKESKIAILSSVSINEGDIVDIDLASLKHYRERFNAWLDADLFKIIL